MSSCTTPAARQMGCLPTPPQRKLIPVSFAPEPEPEPVKVNGPADILVAIGRATEAWELRFLEAEAKLQDDLHRPVLLEAVRLRFGRLNAEAVGTQKPRW